MANLRIVAEAVKEGNKETKRVGNLLEQLVDLDKKEDKDRFTEKRSDVLSDSADKKPSVLSKMSEGFGKFEIPKTKAFESIINAFKTIAGLGAISWLASGGMEKVSNVVNTMVDVFQRIASGDFLGVWNDLYSWIKEQNSEGKLNELLGLSLGGAGLTLAMLFGAKSGLRLAVAGFAFAAADGIGNWITEQSGSENLGDIASLTTKGGALGAMFGPKGALVGAVGGFSFGVADAISKWIEEKSDSTALGDFAKTTLRTLAGAGTGAAAGAMFGPPGMIVGAIVGAVGGWLSGFISWAGEEGEENKTKGQKLKDDMRAIGKFIYDPETGKVFSMDWGQLITDISTNVRETARALPGIVGNMFIDLWNSVTGVFTDFMNGIIEKINSIPGVSLKKVSAPEVAPRASDVSSFDFRGEQNAMTGVGSTMPGTSGNSQIPIELLGTNQKLERLTTSPQRAERINTLIREYKSATDRGQQEELIKAMQEFVNTATERNAAGIGAVVNQVTNNNTIQGTPLSVDIPQFD